MMTTKTFSRFVATVLIFTSLNISSLPNTSLSTSSDQTVELIIVNNSGSIICGIYIILSTSESWGRNLLDGDQLDIDDDISYDLKPDKYNLAFDDCQKSPKAIQEIYDYKITNNTKLLVASAFHRRDIPSSFVSKALGFWDGLGGGGGCETIVCVLGKYTVDACTVPAISKECQNILGGVQDFSFSGFNKTQNTQLVLSYPNNYKQNISTTGNSLKLTFPETSQIGVYSLTAEQGNQTLSGSFYISRPSPEVTVDKLDYKAGETITTSLLWFAPNQKVNLYLYHETDISIMGYPIREFIANLGSYKIDKNGNFTITVPTSTSDPNGIYMLLVDSTKDIATSFAIKNGKPELPSQLIASSICGEATVTESNLEVWDSGKVINYLNPNKKLILCVTHHLTKRQRVHTGS